MIERQRMDWGATTWMPNPLSRRERDMLEVLVVDGASNKEIGRRLFLSEKTVKFHMAGAMRKLGATNRTHLALLYMKLEDR